MSDLILRRNLLALAKSHAEIGNRLLEAGREEDLAFKTARSGAAVPVLRRAGRDWPFHSIVDPEREADRLVAAQPPGGFIVALGLGAGYSIRRYLASPATTGIIIVEYSASLLRAILEELDLSEIFLDERVSMALDPSPEELHSIILKSYIPPLAGDIRSLPLRARVDIDPEKFGEAARVLVAVLGKISDDYSVQAFFGKLWFKNALRNLFLAERPAGPLRPIRRAVVTAAGPSLELSIPEIKRLAQGGAFVIATDTSLPALVGAGILPGAAVSIDCQQISYYHFIGGIPPGVPLVLDLASPNRLARLTDSIRFFSSGHPFCAYVSSRWRPFPALDTSGGNVTHAALSLAEALGAESAYLAGADFSYPEGKSYARGTYIYAYFDSRQRRLAPLEGHFSGFVFRNASVSREEGVDSEGRSYSRYLTKPLVAYREHLERFAAGSSMRVEPMSGKGVEISIERKQRPEGQGRDRALFAAGRPACGAAEFLEGYLSALRGLPEPRTPAATYLRSLKPEERDLWTTLLPAASAFQRSIALSSRVAALRSRGAALDSREATLGGQGAAELLSATREWAMAAVSETLADSR
jgi:hypothetical protein